MSAASGAAGMRTAQPAEEFEEIFHRHYARVARTIARLVRDTARAEELAAEVFWGLWKNPAVWSEEAGGWLYRTAVRAALYELRRAARRARYLRLLPLLSPPATPEETHAAGEERAHVRAVLAAMHTRQAELLLLRSEGLSYQEMASALGLNPASVGTMLTRAQQAFRKEYLKQYGKPRD